MNRTILFFIIVFSFIGNQAIARIGETSKQCKNRYGIATSFRGYNEWIRYVKDGFVISVRFYDDKAGVISFVKQVPMPLHPLIK